MSSKASTEQQAKGKKKPIVPIAIGAVIVVLCGGLWSSGVMSHLTGHPKARQAENTVEKPSFVDLPDIVSNLDSGTHRAAFVKVKAKIEVSHAVDAIAVQAAFPQILDVFQTYLRSTRPDELRGGEGTYHLREALMNRIDVLVYPVQINGLLFTELLVQ